MSDAAWHGTGEDVERAEDKALFGELDAAVNKALGHRFDMFFDRKKADQAFKRWATSRAALDFSAPAAEGCPKCGPNDWLHGVCYNCGFRAGDPPAAAEGAAGPAKESPLVKFLRGEGFNELGAHGDRMRWSPEETAINAMRELLRLRRAPAARPSLPDEEELYWRYEHGAGPSLEEIREGAKRYLSQRYVVRADPRQRELGLSYIEAETGDLAKTVAVFTMATLSRLQPADAKASTPERRFTPSSVILADTAREWQEHLAEITSAPSTEARPAQEAGEDWREGLVQAIARQMLIQSGKRGIPAQIEARENAVSIVQTHVPKDPGRAGGAIFVDAPAPEAIEEVERVAEALAADLAAQADGSNYLVLHKVTPEKVAYVQGPVNLDAFARAALTAARPQGWREAKLRDAKAKIVALAGGLPLGNDLAASPPPPALEARP